MGTNGTLLTTISSSVAAAAINAVVKKVNKEQEDYKNGFSSKSSMKETVNNAFSILDIVNPLYLDAETRWYHTQTWKSLYNIKTKLNEGGCYIATMAYGSYDHPQVMVLRNFRDDYLSKREWGRNFIKYYYKHSPDWVEKLKDYKLINLIIRYCLDCIIIFLNKYKKH